MNRLPPPPAPLFLRRVVPAGIASFALVFLAGVALGTLRTMVLEPALGPLGAVALELPFMLIIAWLVTRRCVEAFGVPAEPIGRAIMGNIAFDLLIAAEIALALTLGGISFTDWLAALITPAGLLGLAGQIAYGAMPLALLVRERGVGQQRR